ncbi:MAG: hypothetical protein ACE5H1_11970 [Thermodesulfobacteriota bacterium]
MARIAIKRFVNKNGDSIALPEDSVYGNEIPGFLEEVKRWLNSKQNINPGVYQRKGGEYSDTFSKTKIVEPKNVEDIINWYNGEDPNARFSTWTVVNNLANDDQEFNTREEAEQYVAAQDDEEYWRHWAGDDWLQTDKNGNYIFKVYRIVENPHDLRSSMKQVAIRNILEAPRGTYPMSLIKRIKGDLDFSDQFGTSALMRENFAKKYPELMEPNDYYQMGRGPYFDYINALPEGHKKDTLKNEELEVITSYLQNPQQIIDEDVDLSQITNQLRMSTDTIEQIRLTEHYSLRFSIVFQDKILNPLKELFKPIPNNVVQQLINFSNIIKQFGLKDERKNRRRNENYENQIISRIVHTFFVTETDTPLVQNFIWQVVNSSRYGDNHTERNNYSDINVETIGSAISQLGENGRKFIPWAEQKLKEEQEYYQQLIQENSEKQQFHGHSLRSVKKNIERYLYIIDALKNGTGHSTKYRFF